MSQKQNLVWRIQINVKKNPVHSFCLSTNAPAGIANRKLGIYSWKYKQVQAQKTETWKKGGNEYGRFSNRLMTELQIYQSALGLR